METDSNHHLLGLPQAVHSGLRLEVDLRCMPSVKPILPLLQDAIGTLTFRSLPMHAATWLRPLNMECSTC